MVDEESAAAAAIQRSKFGFPMMVHICSFMSESLAGLSESVSTFELRVSSFLVEDRMHMENFSERGFSVPEPQRRTGNKSNGIEL